MDRRAQSVWPAGLWLALMSIWPETPGWVLTVTGIVAGAFGTLAVAFINRTPALSKLLDDRVRFIIEESHARISELKVELRLAELKAVEAERKAELLQEALEKLQHEVEVLRAEVETKGNYQGPDF